MTPSWLGALTTATVVGGGVRVRVCACMRVCDVFAIYDSDILPRLIVIMIIFKISFLYFLQIRHTDDLP